MPVNTTPTQADRITVHLHPDTLYDEVYDEVEVDASGYDPLCVGKCALEHTERAAQLRFSRGGGLRVTAPLANVLRLQASCQPEIPESTTVRLGFVELPEQAETLSVDQDGPSCRVTSETMQFSLDGSTGDFVVDDVSGDRFLASRHGGIRLSSDSAEYGGEAGLCSFDVADESFFGFGGRISAPLKDGASADIFTVKGGLHIGDYGGFPVPFFLSTKGYGVFLNNPWPHVYFDMGRTNPDAWFFHAPGGECDLFVIRGDSFGEIVRTYTELTGRPPLPPRWTFGFWCSSLNFETADQVTSVVRRLREEKWPFDVFVLDGTWRAGPEFVRHYKKYHEYPNNDADWNPAFGDGPDLLRELSDADVRLFLHLNSRIYTNATVARGLEEGWLRQHGEEVVPRVGDEAGDRAFQDLVEPRIREGVAGWWTDHADRVSGELSPGLPSRNLFGGMWNRLLTGVQERNGQSGALVLTRGGGIGAQRYSIPWPGDTRAGIDAFEEDVWFCLNAGLAGYPYTSVDIGGFTPPDYEGEVTDERDYEEVFNEENIRRRLCQSIFCIPIPRIHNGARTLPRLPWNCPEPTRELYRAFLELRYRYTPYIYAYAVQAARTGEPIVRPLVYQYQDDPRVYAIGDQLLLGEWLLVAPVVQAGVTKRKIYLPAGTWTHLWSERRYEGPAEIEIEAPIDDVSGLPVFVRAGAILPTQPLVQFLDDNVPEGLTLDVYPAGSSSFELAETAQVTNRMSCRRDAEGCRVTVTNGFDFPRRYRVVIHGVGRLGDVKLDAETVPDAVLDSERRTVSLDVAMPSGAERSVDARYEA